MAEEQQDLRRINWSELFPFTNVFKSFRMAIHPSKLLLGLVAAFLMLASVWVLDLFWGPIAGQYAQPREPLEHLQKPPVQFSAELEAWRDNRPNEAAAFHASVGSEARSVFARGIEGASSGFKRLVQEKLASAPPQQRRADELTAAGWRDNLSGAKDDLDEQVSAIEGAIEAAVKGERTRIEGLSGEERDKAEERLREDEGAALRALTAMKVSFDERLKAIRGEGVGETFIEWEWRCISSGLWSAWRGNFTGGLENYSAMAARRAGVAAEAAAPAAGMGFLFWLLMGVGGVVWLVSQHWLYAILLALVLLAVWSIFGGAIYRIAALHAAREEKISIVQALRFSLGKFFGFFTAPIIPLGLIWALGLILMIGGLIGNIPWAGPIIMGFLFFLAVLLGLVIAFVFIGLTAGWNLMYPTIAVEGSDSFDAISRSFAYVLMRPWHAAFYALVALVYGAICYLFVRFFALLTLWAAHFFTSLWLFGGQSVGGDSRMDTMWTEPTFDSLHGPFVWQAMSTPETIGAWFIWFFTGIIALMVFAFLLTFLASSATVIYYLLRHKVDATDMDDVYVEEPPPGALAAATADGGGAQPPADAPPEAPSEPAQ
jgi:hypothetical protein